MPPVGGARCKNSRMQRAPNHFCCTHTRNNTQFYCLPSSTAKGGDAMPCKSVGPDFWTSTTTNTTTTPQQHNTTTPQHHHNTTTPQHHNTQQVWCWAGAQPVRQLTCPTSQLSASNSTVPVQQTVRPNRAAEVSTCHRGLSVCLTCQTSRRAPFRIHSNRPKRRYDTAATDSAGLGTRLTCVLRNGAHLDRLARTNFTCPA